MLSYLFDWFDQYFRYEVLFLCNPSATTLTRHSISMIRNLWSVSVALCSSSREDRRLISQTAACN